MRRSLMFYTALAATLMVFGGSVLIAGFLRDHPLVFLVFWAVCAWLTIASVLLAVFDILVLRAAARAERKKLQREIFDDDKPAS